MPQVRAQAERDSEISKDSWVASPVMRGERSAASCQAAAARLQRLAASCASLAQQAFLHTEKGNKAQHWKFEMGGPNEATGVLAFGAQASTQARRGSLALNCERRT